MSKWNRLDKISRDIYELNPEKDPQVTSQTFQGVNFSQVAVDDAGKRLVAIDTRGYVYHLELCGLEDPKYKKIGKYGLSTCVAFNPLDQSEILLASTTNEIRIFCVDATNPSSPLAHLSGHRYAVSWMSFHRGYCLSVSTKEAIIWDLRTCTKLHQLRLGYGGANLKKSAFSNSGQIAALYSGDALQIWPLEDFNRESRISLRDFNVRGVQDFAFTQDARAMAICATKGGILILDTLRFELIARFCTPDDASFPKRIAIIPRALDTGVNRILAILNADGSLRFMDLGEGTFVETQNVPRRGIRNFRVTAQGGWLVCVETRGNLNICRTNTIFSRKNEPARKIIEPGKTRKAHRVDEHLRYVKQDVREELGLCRLLPILKEFGEYPEKHRIVIWTTLMKLPANREACIGLSEKLSQEASVRNMLDEYPLADRSKATLLATTIDRLSRWCPLLAQCQFLPALVFPFLVVFQKNPLLALETSMTILSNFCQKWFEYHPLPPLNVLGIMENVLLESDPALLTYFCERGITSTDYAWPLLRTSLSEVLASNEWLVLWDHLLTKQRPSLLLMCVVAYSICSRETVMSLLRKPDDFQKFYATQGNVGTKELLKVAYRLDNNTPERIHPNRYLRDNFVALSKEGPYTPFLMHEYPRFLTEQQSEFVQLRALEEEEKILREYRRRAMKIAEEKRLRAESENFIKEIHRNRMMELQRCHGEQLRITRYNVENARDEIRRCVSSFGETKSGSMEHNRPVEKISAKSSGRSESATTSSPSRFNSFRQLRNQVQQLESEVQYFLGALRTKSSVNIVR